MPEVKTRWVDGECWLCDQDGPVVWIGPVTTIFGTCPMFACQLCIERLEARVRRHNREQDNAPPT
ncbi:hypothetical protein [Streptomyces sp. NPDC053560]|uniref:hypothetical protein n=1 Tax=Streptomyces sp. NPDC053560 TaxID=3365711 RepID=UPI0037D0709A